MSIEKTEKSKITPLKKDIKVAFFIGGSRDTATCKMENFVIKVND